MTSDDRSAAESPSGDRSKAAAPGSPAAGSRRFFTVPGLLLALIALILAYPLREKYSAVAHFMPLRGWALADFLRINLAFFGFVLVWGFLLLQSRQRVLAARAIAVTLVLHLATLDLANTEIIRFTGALAPSDAAYYMGRAADALPLTIVATELLTLVVIPLFFLGAFVFAWRQLAAAGGRRRAFTVAAAAAALLAAALAPPFAAGLELDKTRPSYLYHVADYVARKTWKRPEPMMDPAFAAAPAIAATGAPKRNLVFIVLESIGASATSLYNPSLPGTTPFLESLAGSSWMAERAYAVVPHTSKALVAINCGRMPFPYHPIFESTLGVPGPCLAHLLGERGYATAFFQAPTQNFENRGGLAANLGFEHFVSGDQLDPAGFQLANYFGYEEEILMAPSREWLQQRGGEPFFALYLTGATHHPYWSPDRYGYRVFDSQNFEYDSYLNAVRYVDHFVGNVLQQYRELGLYDDTVFVIVGDHGEGMGQHNRLQHNANLYQEVLQVPLLVHAPGLVPAVRAPDLVSQVDLLPSLLPLAGFAATGGGEGVAHGFSPGPLAPPRTSATAACWFEYWCTATIDQRYKYIYNFALKAEELYDLEADPHEHRNIAASEPAKVAELRREAIARYDGAVGRWHAFLRAKDAGYWSRREDTLGRIAPLYKLSPDDRRLKERRIDTTFDF